MERLADELYDFLSGKLETISMMDLRKHPGEVLDAVNLGKTFVISKSGRPLAVLQKLPGGLTIVVDGQGKISYEVSK